MGKRPNLHELTKNAGRAYLVSMDEGKAEKVWATNKLQAIARVVEADFVGESFDGVGTVLSKRERVAEVREIHPVDRPTWTQHFVYVVDIQQGDARPKRIVVPKVEA